jgi:hypothetical protein
MAAYYADEEEKTVQTTIRGQKGTNYSYRKEDIDKK